MREPYSLGEDQEISINGGTNTLVIKNNRAKMKEADCPDQLCVNQKAISKNNESIICLPNKVVVEVESSENSEFDAVSIKVCSRKEDKEYVKSQSSIFWSVCGTGILKHPET